MEYNSLDQGGIMNNYIEAEQLRAKINSTEDIQLIDVREAIEYHSEKIAGAISAPLSKFNESSEQINQSEHAYLICKSGGRAKEFAEKLNKIGYQNFTILEGGMTAWMEKNYAIVKGKSKVWSLERQVRIAAGGLVLCGVILSFAFNLNFIFISAFVGMGLVFSGITDTCGMGLVLAKMPWNSVKEPNCNVN